MNAPDYSVATTLTLTVDVSEHVPLPVAAQHAAILANRVGFWVRFKFADIDCFVAPNCVPDDLLEEFHASLGHQGSLVRPPAVARPGGNARWKP